MLSFTVLILCFTISQTTFIHPVSEDTYEILLKLCKNEFTVPVAARSNTERAAVIKFWRSRGKFTCKENILHYDGRKVR